MKTVKNIIFLFMLLSPMTSFSQVNIETLRNESENKNKKVLGEIKLGMEFKVGNVNITKTTSSMLIHYFHSKHHVFSKISHNWSSQNKKTFEKNYFGHFRWTFMGTKKIGLEIFSQIQSDDFKDLKLRQLNGLGARLELIKNKKNILSIGSGVMSDYEIIKDKNKSLSARSTSYLSAIKSFSNKNKLMLTTYYQPLFVNFKDYRINLEGVIRVSLIDELNIFIDNTFNYQLDTNPPEDVVRQDFVTMVNLTYEW